MTTNHFYKNSLNLLKSKKINKWNNSWIILRPERLCHDLKYQIRTMCHVDLLLASSYLYW